MSLKPWYERTLNKDANKSIGWLALDKPTQEKLISMQAEFEARQDTGFDDVMEYHKHQAAEIHTALGTSGSFEALAELNEQLENILRHYNGTACELVEGYWQKFNDIKAAIEIEVKNTKKKHESLR